MNYESYTMENNPIAYRIIKNSFSSNKISHSYLFSAQKNYKIEAEVLFLINKLISKHGDRDPLTYPDLTILDGSKGIISKESVVLAIEKLQQTSLDDLGIKILWIKNIENGNAQSLNSLLKFIEEPTKKTFIVMTTNAISQVLSTIKSRSQVITLKSTTLKAFIEFLQINKFKTSKAKIIASVASSKEHALSLGASQEFEDLTKDVIKSLANAINHKEKTHSEFSPLIRKDNFAISLNILAAFFNDIWKIDEVMEIIFEDEKELVQNYKVAKFDFEKALMLISDFLIKVNYNVNFDLYKNKFLVELEECYV